MSFNDLEITLRPQKNFTAVSAMKNIQKILNSLSSNFYNSLLFHEKPVQSIENDPNDLQMTLRPKTTVPHHEKIFIILL